MAQPNIIRFKEEKRLPSPDPIPRHIGDKLKVNARSQDALGRGRIALAVFFNEIGPATPEDPKIRRLVDALPQHIWENGSDIEDLELYLRSTFGVISGEEPADIAASLHMSLNEYAEWWDSITADLSTRLSLDGLARAAGFRITNKPDHRLRGTRPRTSRIRDNLPRDSRLVAAENENQITNPAEYAQILAARKDQQAFSLLLRQYQNLLTYIARSYFLAGGEYQDLEQEAYIGFHNAVRDFDPTKNSNFTGFVRLCATRQVITAIKTATRYKHSLLNSYVSFELTPDGVEGDGATIEASLPSKSLPAEDLVIGKESLRGLIEMLINGLSDFEAQVLKLYLESNSYEQISEALGQDTKAVDNAIQRVKRKILNARESDYLPTNKV